MWHKRYYNVQIPEKSQLLANKASFIHYQSSEKNDQITLVLGEKNEQISQEHFFRFADWTTAPPKIGKRGFQKPKENTRKEDKSWEKGDCKHFYALFANSFEEDFFFQGVWKEGQDKIMSTHILRKGVRARFLCQNVPTVKFARARFCCLGATTPSANIDLTINETDVVEKVPTVF